jgi:putative oxidoreductase
MVKDFLTSYTREQTLPSEIAMTILRVTAGLSIALAHGHGKIKDPGPLAQGLTAMGFPAPEVLAWLVAIAEFVGGIFLAIGLLTRAAAAGIGIVVGTAFFIVHAADPFMKKELALLYLVIVLVFFFRGAGKWSVDRFIGRG